MRSSTLTLISHFLLLGLVFASLHSTSKRATSSGNFQLYAYGNGIGGLPVFSTGSTVYIGDPTQSNSTDAAPVIFTSSSTSFLGNPNTTAVPSSSPSWSNLTLAIPSSSSSSHAVTLVSSSNATSDVTTTGFTFYGRFLFILESGAFESLFYALPTENQDVWSLNWNTTGDDTEGQVLVSLRNAKPTNGAANTTDVAE
ncbi:hypothetical protein BR93DRAFT_985408 [Coniochaeta sp. PMI_546]|nr:hypothetical protein BR93DRAFT_985408 [Coniochaeta sp. PMI_546]